MSLIVMAYHKTNCMDFYLMAQQTAKELMKEHPEWDVASLMNETMEIIEMEIREDLAYIERHLRDFLNEHFITIKKKSDDKE